MSSAEQGGRCGLWVLVSLARLSAMGEEEGRIPVVPPDWGRGWGGREESSVYEQVSALSCEPE